MPSNDEARTRWGAHTLPEMAAVIDSCMGYARTPGWAVAYQALCKRFTDTVGLRSIELGCGQGKISLMLSFLGVRATLLDYSEKQIAAAKYIHDQFHLGADLIRGSLLDLPFALGGGFDIAMSFGVAEHFWGDDRQAVFDSHSQVLKKNGIVIMWVPNRWGVLFHLGRSARRLLHRVAVEVEETAFTRRELRRRAKRAGFGNIQICGGEHLANDFNHFIFDLEKRRKMRRTDRHAPDLESARNAVVTAMQRTTHRLSLWNDLCSYPLVLIGLKR